MDNPGPGIATLRCHFGSNQFGSRVKNSRGHAPDAPKATKGQLSRGPGPGHGRAHGTESTAAGAGESDKPHD